ncbi:MAG: glycosyltransferase [Bacteroidota bacterium]
MKIAFLSVFPPFRGGISQFSASLFDALNKNHDVVAFNFKRQYPQFLFPGKSQYLDQGSKSSFPSQVCLDSINPFSYGSTAKLINAENPDLLLTNFWLPYLGPSLTGVLKRIGPKCKKLSILHNVIPHESRPLDAYFTKRFVSRSDEFLVMSEHVKNNLLKILPKANFIQREHPYYDHFGKPIEQKKAIKELNLDEDKRTLLFFGFIRKYKGLDLLIEAMNLLPKNYQLIIAGESYEDLSYYQEMTGKFMLNDRIKFHSKFISDEKIPLYFSAADLVVLPYRSATQSGIVPIAYHFDKPVISTKVGGLKESVLHGKTGLLVDQPQAENIARSIEEFFSSSMPFKEEIIKRKKENSWHKFANEIVAFASR